LRPGDDGRAAGDYAIAPVDSCRSGDYGRRVGYVLGLVCAIEINIAVLFP
jgi:hypothetical protein